MYSEQWQLCQDWACFSEHSLVSFAVSTVLLAGKHVFGISDKARLKPSSAAKMTSWENEILLVASLDMTISKSE